MAVIYQNEDLSLHKNNDSIDLTSIKNNMALTVNDDGEILNEYIVKLLDNYIFELLNENESFTPIHVDEVASRIAKIYEKIRKIIDWKDDNALRRGAIERILKRIIFPNIAKITVKKFDIKYLAETLTFELIRGGHLPNNSIPLERLIDVERIIKKYLIFLDSSSKFDIFAFKQRVNYINFLIEISACEIEEILTNPFKEYGIINAMSKCLENIVRFEPNDFLKNDEIKKFLLISTIKTLYDLDDKYISYILLKLNFPNWNILEEDEIRIISKKLPEIWNQIEIDLKNKILKKFTRVAEYVDTIFLLIDDILLKYKNKPNILYKIFDNKIKFEKEIKIAYKKRYSTLKTRLIRLAIFSTLSVFLSNWFTFFIIEVPLAKLFYEGFNLKAAIIDFLIPTFVMFLLVSIIKLPSKDNMNKVINLANSIVYKNSEKRYFQIKFDNGKPSLLKIFMVSLYIEIIIFAFIGIAYLFYIGGLPMTSVIFDTFTISLTFFAAVAIKNKSKELNVDEDTTIGSFLLDMLSVPIAKVGAFLARKWKEYNVVAILFNFLIETPFAVILNLIQGWSDFISEEKQEFH